MVTLQDMKQAVDNLSTDERQELLLYIQQQSQQDTSALSPQERVKKLRATAQRITNELTDAEWHDIENDD
jgi:hypothetical protein